MFILGSILVGIVIGLAVFAPLLHTMGIIPFAEYDFNYSQKYLPPFTVDNRTYVYWEESSLLMDSSAEGTIRVTSGSLHGNNLTDLIYGDEGGNVYITKNTGTRTTPSFETPELVLINNSENSPLKVNALAQPCLTNINGDDLIDMIMGTENGSVYYSLNVGNANNPIWSSLLPVTSSSGEQIQVGSKASPTLYDIDKDGLNDMIIGTGNGSLFFYENTGNATHWKFQPVEAPKLNFITEELVENGFTSPVYPTVFKISDQVAYENLVVVTTINEEPTIIFLSATRKEIMNKEYREITSAAEIILPDEENYPNMQALTAIDIDGNERIDMIYFNSEEDVLQLVSQFFTVDGRIHLLGLNKEGADVFSYCLWALRIDLIMALWIVSVGIVIGLVLGSLAGYFGGKVDNVVMRVTDVFYAFPSIILAMAIASVLGRNMFNLGLSLIAVWWTGYTRLIRAQVLLEREKAYVEAARAQGFSNLRILFRHILPNSWYPILVQSTLDLGAVTLSLAGLSFIGFGAGPGEAELGRMIADGRQRFPTIPGLTFFPGIFIFIMVMGWNLVGDGLRDILDPKLRR
jgi:peptide/nickel transport system permease protein